MKNRLISEPAEGTGRGRRRFPLCMAKTPGRMTSWEVSRLSSGKGACGWNARLRLRPQRRASGGDIEEYARRGPDQGAVGRKGGAKWGEVRFNRPELRPEEAWTAAGRSRWRLTRRFPVRIRSNFSNSFSTVQKCHTIRYKYGKCCFVPYKNATQYGTNMRNAVLYRIKRHTIRYKYEKCCFVPYKTPHNTVQI